MTATESGFGQYVIETALSAIRDNTVGVNGVQGAFC